MNARRLSRFVVPWLALLIVAPLHAETSTTTTTSLPPLVPLRTGYAFDKPKILVQQRLFGLIHGVTLLAATCAHDTSYRETATMAYDEWQQQQMDVINELVASLSRYYFGDRANEAGRHDIATALNLVNRLDLKPGSNTWRAACDSFPAALKNPRYDVQQQYLLQSLASRLAVATSIEAEAAACRARLSDEMQSRLDEAMAQWHKAYDTRNSEAREKLEQQWPDAQIEGTLDEWLGQARENGKRKRHTINATAPQDVMSCTDMPSWLLTTQSDPDDEFKPAH